MSFAAAKTRSACRRTAAATKAAEVSALACWRSGSHATCNLILVWHMPWIAFTTLGRTQRRQRRPAGDLVAGVVGSTAEFERSRIQERIHAGLPRAKAQGKRLERRRSSAARRLDDCAGLSHPAASIAVALRLGAGRGPRTSRTLARRHQAALNRLLAEHAH